MRRPTSALFPVAFLGLALAVACDGSSPAPTGSGAQLYARQCSMCHGSDASGSPLAPTLHGKKAHWTRSSLIAYLKDPQATIEKDARLKAQKARYSLPMTTFKMLPEPELEALADHVLSLP